MPSTMSETDPARPPLDYERRERHAQPVEDDNAERLLKTAAVIGALLLTPAAVIAVGAYWWMDVYGMSWADRPFAVAPVVVFFTIVVIAIALVVLFLVRPRRSMAFVLCLAILVGFAALMEGICFAQAAPRTPTNPPTTSTQPAG